MIDLAILSFRSEIIKRFLQYLEGRYPHHHERVEKWKAKFQGWFKKD